MGDSVAAPAGRPLVGRDQELERVHAALDGVARGRGQVVFVVGHMGIGKTRLAEETLALARWRQFQVLVGRSPPAGSGLAYAPVLAAFGAVLRSLDAPQREAMVGDLPHLGRLWPELGLPPPAPVRDPDLERALLFEAVARLLERLASRSPVALFVDDIHWADAPSLALLGYLIPGLTALPVLLIGAYRPEGVAENKGLREFLTNARRSAMVAEVALQRLNREGVAALATAILGDAPPASLLDFTDRAGGTPLFVDALVRGLVETGALLPSPEGWTLAEDESITLPQGLQELVADRLDVLTADDRSTVELIAHGPQGLQHDVLEHVAAIDPQRLLDVVRRLIAAELLVQEEVAGEVTYRLDHPLIQEVAVTQLPAVASRRVHARLAQATESLHPRDLDRLAYHYSRAGREVDESRTLEVLLEAGERAHGLAARDEAARHFGATLPLIRDGKRPDLLAHVLERMGQSWEPLGETAAAIEVWTEAVADLHRAGDVRGVARLRRRLAIAAQSCGDLIGARHHLRAGVDALRELPPSEELVELYAARLFIDTPLLDPERAKEAVAELSRLAEVLQSPRATAEALLSMASLWVVGGLPIQSPEPIALDAARIAADAGEWGLARRAYRELAWIAFIFGDHAAMRRYCEAQVEIDHRLGDSAHLSGIQLQLCYAALFAGKFDESVALGEAAVAHARQYGQLRAQAMALGGLALARVYRGELNAAEECLVEARRIFPEASTDPRGGSHMVGWAEAALALEQGDGASPSGTNWWTERVNASVGLLHIPMIRLLVGAAQISDGALDGALATAAVLPDGTPSTSFSIALADRLRGMVEHARGESGAAREHLERSVTALAALDLPFEVAVSRLHLGTEESLREALATFESLGAARYADRARRALRALGVRLSSARSSRGTGGPLSHRELEVARLVAEGLSNAEIAQRLVLSVRTVETHLGHIYSRLGISSRVGLAAWVGVADEVTPIT